MEIAYAAHFTEPALLAKTLVRSEISVASVPQLVQAPAIEIILPD